MAEVNAEERQLPQRRVRTPTLLQMEMSECGAACLGIILGYYGRVVPLAELRQRCGVSRDGSKASNVVKAAAHYGLIAKGFKKDLADLGNVPYPYVVFWHFNHFVVVDGCRRDRVFLNDPATGPRAVTLDEFDDGFTGVVLSMVPGPSFERGGSRPSVLTGVLDRVRGSLGAFLLVGLASLLLVLPGLAAPALTQVFVDNVLVQRMEDWARPIILGVAIAALLKGALTAVQLRLLRKLQIKLAVSMAGRFVWHLLRLPADFYAQRYSGEIASRIGLNDRAADVLSGRLASTAIDVLMIVFYGVVMWHVDHVLTMVAAGFAAAHLIILRTITRRRVDANRRLIQEYGRVAGTGIAGLQSIRTIKASALESDFFARLAGHYAKAVNTQQDLTLANLYLTLLPRFVSAVMAMLILVWGGARVMDGALTIGMLVAFQSLAASFLAPVGNLLGLASALQDLEGDVARLDDVLLNPARPPDVDRIESHEGAVRLDGRVDVQDLRFGYALIDPPLVDGFSFTLAPGQRIALVGGSGSGKSTIARLIAGLYDPWSGDIRFDGRLRSATPHDVMTNSLAVVDQDILLFAGTVRDNLTLWDSTVSDDQMIRACQDAAIHDDIVALPDGYASQLLEGAANLSGGQRQRLEIARALCADPSILILDEATSALDVETERTIDRNLRRRGCSCVIVAHRLSTIRDADEILVLDRGKIVQRGTHEHMIEEPGPYARLVSSDSAVNAGSHGAV